VAIPLASHLHCKRCAKALISHTSQGLFEREPFVGSIITKIDNNVNPFAETEKTFRSEDAQTRFFLVLSLLKLEKFWKKFLEKPLLTS